MQHNIESICKICVLHSPHLLVHRMIGSPSVRISSNTAWISNFIPSALYVFIKTITWHFISCFPGYFSAEVQRIPRDQSTVLLWCGICCSQALPQRQDKKTGKQYWYWYSKPDSTLICSVSWLWVSFLWQKPREFRDIWIRLYSECYFLYKLS